jgi:hypothetical protein
MVVVWGTYFTWINQREKQQQHMVSPQGGGQALLSSSSSLRAAGSSAAQQPPAHQQEQHVLSLAFLQDHGLVDFYDALATDVRTFWDCPTLLQTTKHSATGTFDDDDNTNNNDIPQPPPQRRLQQGFPGHIVQDQEQDHLHPSWDDDGMRMNDDLDVTPNAAHLLCLAVTPPPPSSMAAAGSSSSSSTSTNSYTHWQQQLNCPVTTDQVTKRGILDIWNAARSHVTDDHMLRKYMTLAFEQSITLVGQELSVWDTLTDQGLNYMVTTINNDTQPTVDDGGLWGLDHNLGPGRVFVDVGSGLGTTSLAISLLYPGTRIISIEAAAPNWLYQHFNWECNRQVLSSSVSPSKPTTAAQAPEVTLLLAGVGPDAKEPTAGHYLWKPSLTTATRSWGPESERMPDDIVIPVHLEAWHSLLAQAQVQQIDVLNIDCAACEYNFVPALTNQEFEAIATVMGHLHWGYIPRSRKPSSVRGRKTHIRLCQHENLAKTAKECCDVPDLPVISSFPNQVLEEEDDAYGGGGVPRPATVADVAGSFCDDFTTWAATNFLHDIPNDAGWFQLVSPVAEGY